jgi:tetratricopeptide (TPR) repeat protein
MTARGASRVASLVIAASAIAFAPLVARADAPPAPAPAQGQVDPAELFKRGLDLYEAKDYAGAAMLWERLVELVGDARGWKVLYNLGLAYEQAGDAKRAIERYEAFIQHVAEQTEPLSRELEERRQDAAERAQALKAKNAEPAAPPRAPAPPPPAPSAPQASSATPAPPPRADVPPKRSTFPTTWLLVGAGATVASLALPIALAFRTQNKRDAAEQLGAGNTAYGGARDDYESARTLYYVSYALPAALAAATAIVVLIKAGGGPETVSASFAPRAGGGELRAGVVF